MSNHPNSFLSSSNQIDIIEDNITSTLDQNAQELSTTFDEPVLETTKRLYLSYQYNKQWRSV